MLPQFHLCMFNICEKSAVRLFYIEQLELTTWLIEWHARQIELKIKRPNVSGDQHKYVVMV